MEKVVVACIQQKMRLPEDREVHREDLARFLRVASNKGARLVLFPELGGVMCTAPLLDGFQANLFKRADRARRRSAGIWQRMGGKFASLALRFLDTDYRRLLAGLLEIQPQQVWEEYDSLYSGLAKEFALTLVAPSAYLPDPLDGVIRNLAVVYGPDGELLGYQPKGILHPEDQDLAQPGSDWRVIQTDVGRIGLMLGSDMLYPEVGRLLAYQGAEILLGQGAASDRAMYEKLRAAMLARMQDNQLFAAISFLVGENAFGRRGKDPYAGKSAILAPQEMTPRSSGILVEMTGFRSESVLAALWDFPALAELWESSDTPVRSGLPMEQVGPLLAQLYQKMQQLPGGRRDESAALPAPQSFGRSLDDLPVQATVTARWPLQQGNTVDEDEALDGNGFLRSALQSEESSTDLTQFEEETEEMDALLRPDGGDEGSTDVPPDRADSIR